ncbi:MAG TPA: 30S ribosomal protein S17 [Candidatus Saccharimonadales bacterium]|nr:30S ribosomal protein S17 [Candidatus Saccharimonadales bacterium]
MAKQLIGIVSSNKGDKTIVVTVQTRKTHPLYRKQYTVSKKFMAHDEKNEAQPGDKVAIAETRPVSRRKHHTLDRIVEKPKLRADSLSVTKTDEPERPVAKGKGDEAAATEPVEKKEATS